MTVTANADGLRFRYGLDTQRAAMVGTPCTYGDIKQARAVIEFGRDNSLSGGLIGGEPNNMIPAGSYILRATLIVTEAFTSGGAATLDLGLANADGTYTNLDEDGIDVALAMGTLLQGSVIACDGALVGAGTDRDILANAYLSYDLDTAVLTAGKAHLIVEYVSPVYPDQGTD